MPRLAYATSDMNVCMSGKSGCRNPPMTRSLGGRWERTLDADFHTILAVSGASGPSVIRLRLQGLGAHQVVQLVQNVLARFGGDLGRGSLVTVKAHKITCHRLPIGSSE